ncbi:MAG: hypothetical protein ACI85K_002192 [Hyphomicrobiaceae bacterium]|jgi:hypothetical protein
MKSWRLFVAMPLAAAPRQLQRTGAFGVTSVRTDPLHPFTIIGEYSHIAINADDSTASADCTVRSSFVRTIVEETDS